MNFAEIASKALENISETSPEKDQVLDSILSDEKLATKLFSASSMQEKLNSLTAMQVHAEDIEDPAEALRFLITGSRSGRVRDIVTPKLIKKMKKASLTRETMKIILDVVWVGVEVGRAMAASQVEEGGPVQDTDPERMPQVLKDFLKHLTADAARSVLDYLDANPNSEQDMLGYLSVNNPALVESFKHGSQKETSNRK